MHRSVWVALVFMAGGLQAADPPSTQPLVPGLIRVSYFAGKSQVFSVTDPASCSAVLAWLKKAESGPVSEHAKIGGCDRDAEMEIFTSAKDDKPGRTVELFTSCGHVSGRVVTAEQFGELKKMLTEAPASAPASRPAAAKPADWTKLHTDEGWYKEHKQTEQVFTGVLQRNKEPEISMLMRSRRYQLGDRFIYPGKENADLEKLVGQKVEVKGKPYDVELEGQSVREIWPAAIRPVAEATQPVDDKAVAELIRQLGDDDWKVREAATKKLIEMGQAVNPLLKSKAGEKDLDPEVATRIRVVLAKTGGLPQTAVTDPATGVTVSLENDGTTLAATRAGLMLWKCQFGGEAGTSLKIEDGKVVVLPSGTVVDFATGKILEKQGGR